LEEISSESSYLFQHIFISFFIKVLIITSRDDKNVICVIDIHKLIL